MPLLDPGSGAVGPGKRKRYTAPIRSHRPRPGVVSGLPHTSTPRSLTRSTSGSRPTSRRLNVSDSLSRIATDSCRCEVADRRDASARADHLHQLGHDAIGVAAAGRATQVMTSARGSRHGAPRRAWRGRPYKAVLLRVTDHAFTVAEPRRYPAGSPACDPDAGFVRSSPTGPGPSPTLAPAWWPEACRSPAAARDVGGGGTRRHRRRSWRLRAGSRARCRAPRWRSAACPRP